MNSTFITIIGVIICTGPLWGMAIGYIMAVRGWRIRTPFHRGDDDEISNA